MAPETSTQSNVADEEVMLLADNPEATPQAGAVVLKVAEAEKALVVPPENIGSCWN
mgnify:CR=1 FL=1